MNAIWGATVRQFLWHFSINGDKGRYGFVMVEYKKTSSGFMFSNFLLFSGIAACVLFFSSFICCIIGAQPKIDVYKDDRAGRPFAILGDIEVEYIPDHWNCPPEPRYYPQHKKAIEELTRVACARYSEDRYIEGLGKAMWPQKCRTNAVINVRTRERLRYKYPGSSCVMWVIHASGTAIRYLNVEKNASDNSGVRSSVSITQHLSEKIKNGECIGWSNALRSFVCSAREEEADSERWVLYNVKPRTRNPKELLIIAETLHDTDESTSSIISKGVSEHLEKLHMFHLHNVVHGKFINNVCETELGSIVKTRNRFSFSNESTTRGIAVKPPREKCYSWTPNLCAIYIRNRAIAIRWSGIDNPKCNLAGGGVKIQRWTSAIFKR